MSGTRAIRIATAVGVVLALSTAPTAGAKTFKAGPMRYVTQQVNVASGGALAWDADCPSGSRVTAGGGQIAGAAGDVHITSTFPTDGGDPGFVPDDVWRFQAFNDTASSKAERVHAVCLRNAAGANQLEYPTELRAVGAGNISGFTDISCQAGERVVGGGVSMPGTPEDNEVNSTHPSASFGNPGPPDARWLGRFRTSNGPTNLLEFAICMPQSAVKLRYRTAFKPLFGGQTKTVVAKCPRKKGWFVAGGGVRGVFFDPMATRPWDSKDKRKAPEDGWLVKAGLPLPDTDPVVLQAYAICLKR